jgi:hypothetical protein
VLYLQKKKNNQQKKQYKAIQKFSSATKGTIQIAANFQVLFLQKKKKNFYKLNSSTAKLSKPQHSTAPHSTAQKSTEQPGTPPPPERRCHKLQAQNL